MLQVHKSNKKNKQQNTNRELLSWKKEIIFMKINISFHEDKYFFSWKKIDKDNL